MTPSGDAFSTSTASYSGGHPLLRRAKRYFLLAFFFLIVLASGTLAFLMFASYGEGYRVGTIQKISKKGVFFKTYEGELSQGFIDSGQTANATGVGTRVWYFTVENDPTVLKQIDHAIEANKKVKLFYKEKYEILPWVGDTRQIVHKVEEVQ